MKCIVAEDVEEHICPVVMELSNPDSVDDFRTEAVAVSSKYNRGVACGR